MTRIFSVSLLVVLAVLMTACKDEVSYAPQIEQMKDSVFKTHATTGAIRIEVKDWTELRVVLGDERLYKATGEQKRDEAVELGKIAVAIFGKESELKTGTIIFTKDTRNSSATPPDGVTVTVDIDSLKQ